MIKFSRSYPCFKCMENPKRFPVWEEWFEWWVGACALQLAEITYVGQNHKGAALSRTGGQTVTDGFCLPRWVSAHTTGEKQMQHETESSITSIYVCFLLSYQSTLGHLMESSRCWQRQQNTSEARKTNTLPCQLFQGIWRHRIWNMYAGPVALENHQLQRRHQAVSEKREQGGWGGQAFGNAIAVSPRLPGWVLAHVAKNFFQVRVDLACCSLHRTSGWHTKLGNHS